MRRKNGNGIKKGSVTQVNIAAKDAPVNAVLITKFLWLPLWLPLRSLILDLIFSFICVYFQAVLDKNRHVVSYSYGKNQTVLVEYVADPFKDMFQVRSFPHPITEPKN